MKIFRLYQQNNAIVPIGTTKKIKSQIAISLVCFAMTFVVTLQLRGVKKTQNTSQTERIEVLQENLRREREKNDSMLQQNVGLRDDIQKLREQATNTGDLSERLSIMLKRAEMLAGLTDLEGEGVIITLSDNTNFPSNIENPNVLLIHDSDILRVVNELRGAGAEAISVNGERILSTSEIRCVGSTICINSNRYTNPFEVKAIGNSQTLNDAFNIPGSIRYDLALYGCGFSLRKQNKIKIQKYTGNYTMKYAQELGGTAQ